MRTNKHAHTTRQTESVKPGWAPCMQKAHGNAVRMVEQWFSTPDNACRLNNPFMGWLEITAGALFNK